MSLRITGTSEQVCLSVTRIPSYCNHSFLRVSLSFLVLVLSVIAGVINFSISTASASLPPAKPALTPTATPTIQCGSSGFLPPVNYPVGPNPFAIVAADFNLDGHLDLATVNNSSASVSVLLSRGDGTFQPSVNYSVGSYPQSIAAGDLNRDGTPDLVTANNGAGDISVLLGNSNGTFRQAVSYPVAQYANFVIIVDLSGDSYPDVAVTDLQLGGSVSVLPGNGDGTLGTPTHYHTASNPLSVTAGDANNDSRIDLIVANHDSYSYSVLLGNGNGTFQPAVNYSLGSSASPSYITNADLNNDGYLDLAIANSSFAGSVSVLLGNGNGTFQPEIQYPLGQYTQWVSTGDFSGDGIVDMVAANASSSGQVAVSLGNGDGTFRPAVNYPAGAGPDAIAPGDFNGDGKLDIGASNFGSSNVSILFNACALAGGTLTPTPTGTLPTRTNTPTFTATYTRTPTASATATNSPSLTPTEVCGPMWRAYPNPDLGVYEARLYTLSAVSPNDIWAVGEQHSGASYLGLVEHWNGTQWSVVPAPNPGSSQELNGVAAISANNVWVAGEYRDPSNTTRTLLEHWNGTQFSLVSTPNSQGNANYLDDIDARSASDIWAVGYWSTDNTSAKRTLILHYNGQSWQVVQSPNVGAGNNRLRAVSAIASNDVWAVGYYDTNGANTQQNTLMMHWNGSVWNVVSSPNPPGGFYNVLNGVGAASGTDIWAVGNTYDLNTELTTTLIEHWNGTDWQIVQSPNMQVDANYLNDISVRTATDIWAVGYWSQSGTEQSLTLHWDGTQWSIVRTPYNRYDEGMGGVVALSPTDVWAVGYFEYFTGSDYQDKPLIEHYNDPCGGIGTATSTATPASTNTPIPTATPRCSGERFSDVCPGDYFYQAVIYLSDHGAISGYADGTFRPYNNTTRGQLSKIVVLAEGWTLDTTGGPHFSDVGPSNPFYAYIETAYNHQIISGYSDGTFRWGNNVTRAQLTKIIVLAQNWAITPPGQPTFQDVPATNAFYGYIETAYAHSIISGYSCGTGCLEFRPGNNATRGQIAKIVYNAVTAP